MIEIRKTGSHAITLPGQGITLDGSGAGEGHTFISHAHADHMPRRGAGQAGTVWCTPPTLRLMRLRGFRGEARALAFGEHAELDGCRVSFWPAGHILGSAMTYVETEEGSLLYTGDCRTPPSPASEGFRLPGEVDCLVTEATFPLPVYRWPSHEELAGQVRRFARRTLQEGGTPLFLAYNLGKAQEVMQMLAPLGRPMQIHEGGYKLCEAYEEAGFELGEYAPYDPDSCEGKILVAPVSARNAGFGSGAKDLRLAYCSGWAARESSRTQLTVDELIPLSDHLDFFELIGLCEKLAPKKVWITHTPNARVVLHYLEQAGIDAEYLDDQNAGEG